MSSFKSPAIHQTAEYRAKAAYANMLRRCVGGKAHADNPTYAGVYLRMTLSEWIEWATPRYKKFIFENPGQSPSVARKGDTGNYEIGNIEIISLLDNRRQQKTLLLLRPDGSKLCCRCRLLKDKTAFSANQSRPDGLAHWCKECCRQHRMNVQPPVA